MAYLTFVCIFVLDIAGFGNKYVPFLPSHLGPKNQLPGLSFNALLLKYVYILFLLVYTKIVDLKIQNRK